MITSLHGLRVADRYSVLGRWLHRRSGRLLRLRFGSRGEPRPNSRKGWLRCRLFKTREGRAKEAWTRVSTAASGRSHRAWLGPSPARKALRGVVVRDASSRRFRGADRRPRFFPLRPSRRPSDRVRRPRLRQGAFFHRSGTSLCERRCSRSGKIPPHRFRKKRTNLLRAAAGRSPNTNALRIHRTRHAYVLRSFGRRNFDAFPRMVLRPRRPRREPRFRSLLETRRGARRALLRGRRLGARRRRRLRPLFSFVPILIDRAPNAGPVSGS